MNGDNKSTSRPNPSFVDTTREERFFCSILMHVLLGSPRSRDGVLDLIASRTGGTRLPSKTLEVYTEVAALRDAWAQLGDYKKYDGEVHEKRLSMLHRICTETMGFHGSLGDLRGILDESRGVFFTSTGKFVSPGRWPRDELAHVRGLDPAKLKELRWAFNAKPDILLLSGEVGVLVEAKVVSAAGSNSHTGYDQLAIQHVIASLIPVVTEGIVARPLDLVTLTNKKLKLRNNIFWSEIVDVVNESELDAFSWRALKRVLAIKA